MTRATVLYISDILQQMDDALAFVRGMTYEQFVEDRKTINAVLRSIEVIGEAAKNVPESVRARYPDIPWKEMAGMRDKVIHFYFGASGRTSDDFTSQPIRAQRFSGQLRAPKPLSYPPLPCCPAAGERRG